MKHLAQITAIVLALTIIPASILAAQANLSSNPVTKVEDVALKFIVGSTTYKASGIAGTLTLLDTLELESFPVQYLVKLQFDSRHAGYGDTDIAAQVITTHLATVKVVDGKVVAADLDGRYDELNQMTIEGDNRPTPIDILVTPEMARDSALSYIINLYHLEVLIPAEWKAEDNTVLLGFSSLKFLSGSLTVTVENAVVWKPTFTVIVEYGGKEAWSWTGTVDQNGEIVESETSLVVPKVSPQQLYEKDSRDIIVRYIIDKHPEVKAVEPNAWVEKDLTPEGILGLSKLQYSGDGWTVTISHPVVWKPTFQVEVGYVGSIPFTWKGSVTQGGQVQEIEFTK